MPKRAQFAAKPGAQAAGDPADGAYADAMSAASPTLQQPDMGGRHDPVAGQGTWAARTFCTPIEGAPLLACPWPQSVSSGIFGETPIALMRGAEAAGTSRQARGRSPPSPAKPRWPCRTRIPRNREALAGVQQEDGPPNSTPNRCGRRDSEGCAAGLERRHRSHVDGHLFLGHQHRALDKSGSINPIVPDGVAQNPSPNLSRA